MPGEHRSMDRPGSLPPPSSARLRESPFCTVFRYSESGPSIYMFSACRMGFRTAEDGILKGKPAVGIYPVTITAQNELGQTEHCLQLIVAEHCFRKPPIMGFCSWNAYGNNVTQEDILQTGRDMLRLGLADYGYGYVNLDSSWQGNCDPHGVIVPNEKFPDMKAMCDELHGMGFRAGIYSSPMRTAWGAPPACSDCP